MKPSEKVAKLIAGSHALKTISWSERFLEIGVFGLAIYIMNIILNKCAHSLFIVTLTTRTSSKYSHKHCVKHLEVKESQRIYVAIKFKLFIKGLLVGC